MHKDERKSPVSQLIVLAILVIALIGALIVGTLTTKQSRFSPDLALDLEGGTQIILTPVTTDGSEITDSDVKQAIEIIRQRVDASGVAEAEISSQGGSNIIVALPGNPDQATLDLVRTSALLRLRAVLATSDPAALTAESVVSALGDKAKGLDPKKMTPEDVDKAIKQLADTNGDGKLDDKPAGNPANASDQAWITEKTLYQAYTLQCGAKGVDQDPSLDDPKVAYVACDDTGTQKYIMGPAELEGSNISKASSSLAVNQSGNPTGGWAVNLDLDSAGAKTFGDVTTRLYQNQSPTNLFAIVLDGKVISAAAPSEPILGGNAQITGNFTAVEANSLANQLNFGSLPLHFEVQSEEQISATLGSEQLNSGLIAGLVGLVLIVAYMLWQYHALGVVAIGSIILSTGLSYFVICLLSWIMGYRLSMAGVLGIIISIGVTADSFIVYFERIRDEIRDGRTIRGAIEHGWLRARRTIIISDFVNLIASVVLYILTVGSVRGFAFTLGITTLLDLIVVMMFTYPVMTFLGRTTFFGQGKKGSGLNTEKLESTPIYRGRGYSSAKPKKVGKTVSAVASIGSNGEKVELHDYEFPDERFTSAGAGNAHGGETLAQRKARQRREKKMNNGGDE